MGSECGSAIDSWSPACPGHMQDAGRRSVLQAGEIRKAVNCAVEIKNQPEQGGERSDRSLLPRLATVQPIGLKGHSQTDWLFYKEKSH